MVLKKYIDEDIILVVTVGYFFSQETFLIFKRKRHNMDKHIQRIHWLLRTNCLSLTILWSWHLTL